MGKKVHPFWAFVRETKRKDELEGIRKSIGYYQSSLADVWAKMDTEARSPWIELAKKMSTPATFSLSGGSRTASGSVSQSSSVVPDSMLDLEESDQDRKSRLAMDVIHTMIHSLSDEDIFTRKFFAAATNVRVKTFEGEYQPVELGIISYTLEDGIKDNYFQMLNPGPVPVGYMDKSMTHSRDTHKIPVDGVPNAKDMTSFDNMFAEIIIFINDSKVRHQGVERFVIFTKDDMIEQLEESLKFIAKHSGNQTYEKLFDEGRIIVANMACLMRELLSFAGGCSLLPLCEIALEKVSYDYCPGSCSFHDEIDNNYCALGLVRRLWYKFSDAVIKNFDITPIPFHHLPQSDESAIRVEEGPSLYFNAQSSGARQGVSGSSRKSTTGSIAGSSIADANDWSNPVVIGAVGGSPHLTRDPRVQEFMQSSSGDRRRGMTGIGRGVPKI
jgi:protein maelstrom